MIEKNDYVNIVKLRKNDMMIEISKICTTLHYKSIKCQYDNLLTLDHSDCQPDLLSPLVSEYQLLEVNLTF
jgi:hypothetical protein